MGKAAKEPNARPMAGMPVMIAAYKSDWELDQPIYFVINSMQGPK